MEEQPSSRRVPARLAQATVARQFKGSRIERQLLMQVFDLLWQAAGGVPGNATCGVSKARCWSIADERFAAEAMQGGRP
jgi:hypothetical protein